MEEKFLKHGLMKIENCDKELYSIIREMSNGYKDLYSWEEIEDFLKEYPILKAQLYVSTSFYPIVYYSPPALFFELPILNKLIVDNLNVKIKKFKDVEDVSYLIRNQTYLPFVHLSVEMMMTSFDMNEFEKLKLITEARKMLEYGFVEFDKDFSIPFFENSKVNEENKNLLAEKCDKNGFLNVYRGISDKSSRDSKFESWTLSQNMAEYFAKRFKSKNNRVEKAKISLSNICFFYDSEEEVLLFVSDLEERVTIKENL